MGKLEITGIARREVEYDCAMLSIVFYLRKNNTAEALSETMRQSEEFLKLLLDIGVSMGNIHFGECEISQNYYSNEYTVIAKREFKVTLKFNMKFINAIMDIVSNNGYLVEFDCTYKHTNEYDIHKELLKEALADSRQKAEIIAQNMGKQIVGIESLKQDNGSFNMDYMCMEQESYCLGESHSKLSDEIKAPISTEREEVEVVWIME